MKTTTAPKKKTTKPKREMETLTVPEITVPPTFTLIDEKPRNVLREGRNYGIAFAFAKRDLNNLTLVGPISPCREYLNDQLYSELTGEGCSAHGYYAKREGLLEASSIYVIMAVLPYFHGPSYTNMDKEIAYLNNQTKDLEAFINYFEGLMKVPVKSRLVKISDNRVVCIADLYWAKYTYLISLLSFIFRVGLEAGFKQEEHKDIEKFFLEGECTDSDSTEDVLRKIKVLATGTIPDGTVISRPHTYGILNASF